MPSKWKPYFSPRPVFALLSVFRPAAREWPAVTVKETDPLTCPAITPPASGQEPQPPDFLRVEPVAVALTRELHDEAVVPGAVDVDGSATIVVSSFVVPGAVATYLTGDRTI